MKTYLPKNLLFAYFLLCINLVFGQAVQNDSVSRMFTINEDNDFINLRGKGTDEAYTNGLRLELFTLLNGTSESKLTKWMPHAGKNSINTLSWGITQLMYTPENIQRTIPDPADFAYAGALFVSRSLHSSSPERKYLFKTEIQMGVIGPPSLAKESQTVIHNLIRYQKPMGWEYQIPIDIIINVNFSFEKLLFVQSGWFETIVGSEIKIGTLYNGIGAFTLLRIGNLSPYFQGLTERYSLKFHEGRKSRKWVRSHLILKPSIEYVNRNSLLEGGYFGGKQKLGLTSLLDDKESGRPWIATPRKYLVGIDYGFVFNMNKTAIEITQKVASAAIIGAPHHEVGNISIHFLW